MVAVDQGRGKAGDSGNGKKWIDLRHNQGLKSTGHGDRLSVRMRERKGSLSKTRFLFCKAGCSGRLRRWDGQEEGQVWLRSYEFSSGHDGFGTLVGGSRSGLETGICESATNWW